MTSHNEAQKTKERAVEDIKDVLIELTDATGFDHSPKALEAFAQAEERLYDQLQNTKADWLRSEIEKLEVEKKPESKIEDCENCGEEGYGKAWYGRGRETGDSWGDRYTPTGSVVFCKNCSPEFRIGKEWNGEEIWKKTSDDPQHDALRISRITKTVNKEWNQAITSIITRYKEELLELDKTNGF